MPAFKLILLAIVIGMISGGVNASSPDQTQPPEQTGAEIAHSSISPAEKLHAEQWKLSVEEYERYKEIMRSPRAYFTPNLENNPLLALALESRSESERRKLADRWVQLQFENNVKVISWQLEVNDAWQRLFPGVPRFAYNKPEDARHAISNMTNAPNSPAVGQSSFLVDQREAPRAQLYVSITNCSECSAAFQRQFQAMRSGAIGGVDVHFVDNPPREKIAQWAVDHHLTVRDVNELKSVTLNHADKDVAQVPFLEFY